MPNLEIFEGKSITWILLMALLIGIVYLAKFTRDFVGSTIVKFQKQLEDQVEKSEKREAQLNEQLNKSIENNSRMINSLEKLETRFDDLERNIERRL
ncbi:MAG: hypothetical protein K0R54_2117 [Clostridiaceae bacterium]|jgi:septal ring factor EnvC (AmiA/AmiB activator)|nr:hypothetical protein [Clostridiaceae bacterium]